MYLFLELGFYRLNDLIGTPYTAASNQSEMVIYNQWGDVVYRAAPYKNDWNGTFNNNPLPDGTYYFLFKRDPTAEVIKNFVTIIRYRLLVTRY